MAIYFKYWKLVKITKVKLKKVYFDGWCRWDYKVEFKDLMKNYQNNSYFKNEIHLLTGYKLKTLKQGSTLFPLSLKSFALMSSG